MHVIVTGGGGYIGTTLVPHLLEAGHTVTVIDRFFFGRELLPEHPRLTTIQDDTRKLKAEYFEGIDCVVDLAALSNDASGQHFQAATWAINRDARFRTARLAKAAGVPRYIFPSSCSVYGWQEPGVACGEDHPVNPLSTYAKANCAAEELILPLDDASFCVVVLRLATVFGYSPRVRFDLAINGMTHDAWQTGRLPLLRDGTQRRPFVHVKDAARAIECMLDAPAKTVGGEIFNVCSADGNWQLSELAQTIADTLPREITIEWYGDPDNRSYQVVAEKIALTGWQAKESVLGTVTDFHYRFVSEGISKTPETITLEWYRSITSDPAYEHLARYGGLIDLADGAEFSERSLRA